MTMSEFTYEAAQTVDKPSEAAATPVINRIWPIAVIAFGLGLTAAWACFLGYWISKLIEMVI